MKKIYHLLMVLATAAFTLVGCSEDNDPFITADENSDPKILNSDISSPDGGGKPFGLPGINRDEHFTYEVQVTPTKYTTVTWNFNDQEAVHTGLTIDTVLMAGNYEIKIVATTVAGKQTSRTCKLTVKPLATDPSLSNSEAERWMVPGTTHTISGKNLDAVAGVIIGGKEVADFVNNGNSLTFTVPELPVEQQAEVILYDAAGQKYPNGMANIQAEEYVPSNVKTVYVGPSDPLAWGALEFKDDAYTALELTVGATVRVYISANAGAAAAITTTWWNDINTGTGWEAAGIRHDFPEGGEQVMEYTIETLEFMDEQGFAIVGDGFVVNKIEVEVPSEETIYEGPSDPLAWSALEFKDDAYAALGLAEGKIVRVYITANPGAAGAITTTWWNDINTGAGWEAAGIRHDFPEGGEQVMEYTIETLEYMAEQGFAVVGDGYVINKITLE